MNRNKLIFVVIVVLAFALRFYKLGDVPPSLNWDENSNAYNAYSILKTGRDEYGTFLPLYNRSFDDFKPPVYMYLNVGSVAIFGLTPFAARLPSAIFGTLTVVCIYYLSKFLFRDQKLVGVQSVSLASMLVFAISPWHVHFSRVGFEANVGLFTAVFTVTLLLYSISYNKLLIISALAAGISAYTYHSVRIYLPLLLLAIIFLYRDKFFKMPRKIIISAMAAIVIILAPLILFTPFSTISQRYKTTTAELRREETEKAIAFVEQDQKGNFPLGGIIHNRRVFAVLTMLDNYLWHFDLNFLFTKGDNNFRHHIDNQGMLYLWQLPLLIFGVFLIIKKRNAGFVFILFWLMAAPVAAAPARPAPHAVRSLAMVVPLSLITGMVLTLILEGARRNILFKFLSLAFSITIAVSLFSYLHNYYIHYPLEKASFWQYGYNLAALETDKLKGQYEKIRVDGALEQAYIFWLFSTGFDPKDYQRSGTRQAFDKYIFDSSMSNNPNDLFVTVPSDKERNGFEVLKTINSPDGAAAILIGRYKN